MSEYKLTNEDFCIADAIMDNLLDNPMESLRLYLQARPEVKKMLGGFDPRGLLVESNRDIQVDKVMDYIHARDLGDELGMSRVYKSSNSITKGEIDSLFDSSEYLTIQVIKQG